MQTEPFVDRPDLALPSILKFVDRIEEKYKNGQGSQGGNELYVSQHPTHAEEGYDDEDDD